MAKDSHNQRSRDQKERKNTVQLVRKKKNQRGLVETQLIFRVLRRTLLTCSSNSAGRVPTSLTESTQAAVHLDPGFPDLVGHS